MVIAFHIFCYYLLSIYSTYKIVLAYTFITVWICLIMYSFLKNIFLVLFINQMTMYLSVIVFEMIFEMESEPCQNVDEMNDFATEFLWVGSSWYLIVHEFDESSSTAACDLHKDAIELSYSEVFLCNDIQDVVASETNEFYKMSVKVWQTFHRSIQGSINGLKLQ